MAINSKNTKAEILAAYKELEKQKKVLDLELRRKSVTTSSSETQTKETNKVNNINKPIVAQKNINQTIQILEQLQTGFGSAVSYLSEKLIVEATSLQELQESIAKERQQLEELHELSEIEEDTIDNLIQDYQESNKQLAEELNQQKENTEQEIQELNKAWSKEQENHQREIRQRNEEHQKTKQREQTEYKYNLELARDLDRSEYEQQQQQLYKELAEVRQNLEKQWQEREENIAKQEKEYAEAKEKVEVFAEKLKAKIKQGQEEGKGIGTYQAKIKADLRTKEIEGEKQNYQLQIQALEQTIETQETRINKLSQQLDAAQKQVQDLAVKAIEGTSNRKSFEAMKEIAMEQAKTQQKGK